MAPHPLSTPPRIGYRLDSGGGDIASYLIRLFPGPAIRLSPGWWLVYRLVGTWRGIGRGGGRVLSSPSFICGLGLYISSQFHLFPLGQIDEANCFAEIVCGKLAIIY